MAWKGLGSHLCGAGHHLHQKMRLLATLHTEGLAGTWPQRSLLLTRHWLSNDVCKCCGDGSVLFPLGRQQYFSAQQHTLLCTSKMHTLHASKLVSLLACFECITKFTGGRELINVGRKCYGATEACFSLEQPHAHFLYLENAH